MRNTADRKLTNLELTTNVSLTTTIFFCFELPLLILILTLISNWFQNYLKFLDLWAEAGDRGGASPITGKAEIEILNAQFPH